MTSPVDENKIREKNIFDRIRELPRLLDQIKEYGVYQVFKAAGVPQGREIDTLSRVNPDYPVFEACLLAYEKRLNSLHGECAAIGRPLYPHMTFFTDMFEHYKRLTPSVGGKRAEQVFEAIGKSLALKSPENPQKPVNIGDTGKLESSTTKKRE